MGFLTKISSQRIFVFRVLTKEQVLELGTLIFAFVCFSHRPDNFCSALCCDLAEIGGIVAPKGPAGTMASERTTPPGLHLNTRVVPPVDDVPLKPRSRFAAEPKPVEQKYCLLDVVRGTTLVVDVVFICFRVLALSFIIRRSVTTSDASNVRIGSQGGTLHQ